MSAKKSKKGTAAPNDGQAISAKRDFYDPTRGIHRVLPCVLLAAAVLIGFFMILNLSDKNDSLLGHGVVWLFSGLFSHCAYIIPLLLLWQGIRWRADVERQRAVCRAVYYTAFLIMAGAIRFCFTAPDAPFSFKNFFSGGTDFNGAGLLGSAVGFCLRKATGYIGVPLVSALLVILFFYHFLELTPNAIRQRRLEKVRSKLQAAKDSVTESHPANSPVADASTVSGAPADTLSETPASPLARKDSEELARLHRTEQTERTETEVGMTRKEQKALLKEKKRAQKATLRNAAKEPLHDDGGYFPDGDEEDSFEELRRRFAEEALKIERERMSAQSGKASVSPSQPPAAISDGMDELPAVDTVADTANPTIGVHSAHSDSALNADAAFGTFNPLAPDALMNTAPTVLRPDTTHTVRRETLRPVSPAPLKGKESFRSVPGGIAGEGDGVGSYCIRATHLDIPSTRNPRPVTPAAAGSSLTVSTLTPEVVQDTDTEPDISVSRVTDGSVENAEFAHDYTGYATRIDPVEQKESGLPYVHPATHPSTQPGADLPSVSTAIPFETSEAPDDFAYPSSGVSAAPATNAFGASPVTHAPWMSTPETSEESVVATSHVVDHNPEVRPASPAPPIIRTMEAPAAPAAPPKKAVPSFDRYVFPPISLLNRSIKITNGNVEAEIEEISRNLVDEFRKFKYAIEVKEVTVGPRITRYCISPPAGVRINTLIGLANDIALGLAVKSIRIEPVPNTPYLGVEIPNRNPSTVYLSSLVDTEGFRGAKTVTTVPLGAGVTGQPVFADIAKMPHVLIAGATGMGKSVFMNSILLSILYHARPDEVKLILVDPKRVELSVYNGIPHLLIPPVVEPQKAAGALIWAVGEMERRYHLMETVGMRSIEGYNQVVAKDPSRGEVQPKIIIVIDELNDLMMQARDAVEPAIMSIAQKARAAGIHLILGTQRPSVDVITGVIKANIPSRIAFHVSSGIDSRTILDFYGAEKLLNKGDMLAAIAGAEPIRVQGAFVSDEEVENVTSFLKQNGGPAVYDEIINAQIESETEKYKNSGKRQSERDDDEEMDGSIFEDSRFMEACHVALESGKVSTSLLQRRCSIGYGKAAKYIDIMQSMGIVSAPDGQKPRDILMSKDQFMEMVSRESYSDD